MQIFLFTLGGAPAFRRTLAEAQAALEDRLLDNPGVSDVWWDDASPHEARTYLHGASHSDYEADLAADVDPQADWETTDRLIWPVELGDGEFRSDPGSPSPLGGVTMELVVRTGEGKVSLTRAYPEDVWEEQRLRPHLILNFALNAGKALAARWTSKEST